MRADARRLPFTDEAFDTVAALWMLYHLDRPEDAIREARRVLRPGGVFFTCTSARTNDPELCDGYPATTFDAEEAPEIVVNAFGTCALEVDHWHAPLVRLPDRDAVEAYARSHHLPAHTADRVSAPITLTKRGVLVSATVLRWTQDVAAGAGIARLGVPGWAARGHSTDRRILGGMALWQVPVVRRQPVPRCSTALVEPGAIPEHVSPLEFGGDALGPGARLCQQRRSRAPLQNELRRGGSRTESEEQALGRA